MTDGNANGGAASTTEVPQILSLRSPSAGRYYVAVNRARVGGTSSGDFGSFVLTLDEIG